MLWSNILLDAKSPYRRWSKGIWNTLENYYLGNLLNHMMSHCFFKLCWGFTPLLIHKVVLFCAMHDSFSPTHYVSDPSFIFFLQLCWGLSLLSNSWGNCSFLCTVTLPTIHIIAKELNLFWMFQVCIPQYSKKNAECDLNRN